jgi:hypothetical protein
MKNKYFVLSTLALTFFTSLQGQTKYMSLKWFENYIVTETPPPLDLAAYQTKYERDYKVIVWNDKLSNAYSYSTEVLAKTNFEYLGKSDEDDNHITFVYRDCSKNLIVEVTEWYNSKLSISMQWYSPSVKRSIGYLKYCH